MASFIPVRMMEKKIVGLGEVLWDMLPGGAALGGAPANFAYITTLMGHRGIVASRIGQDSRGAEAFGRLRDLGLDVGYLQTDSTQPTGTVQVEVDNHGQPRYDIRYPVAWDFLEWTAAWANLAKEADAICFGSLAQRSAESRATILAFLKAAAGATAKVFDVNLRQTYYSSDVVAESLQLADIVKLNDEELPRIMRLVGLPHTDEESSAQRLLETYDLNLVCVTRGGRGSLLLRGRERSQHPGYLVRVADTVGAGDAFTAGLLHEYLRGAPLEEMNETANALGAWVASEVGAMPNPKGGTLEEALGEIRRSAAHGSVY